VVVLLLMVVVMVVLLLVLVVMVVLLLMVVVMVVLLLLMVPRVVALGRRRDLIDETFPNDPAEVRTEEISHRQSYWQSHWWQGFSRSSSSRQ
ncbi:hypothetical protein BDV36DRAFT_255408, partial [Aspergillus pseudocaelatus]